MIKQITNKQYTFYTPSKLILAQISPHAVESCMNPGEFMITPIEICDGEQEIIYTVGKEQYVLSKEKLRSGQILVEESDFEPVVIRRKNGCNPCTNCGGCSW